MRRNSINTASGLETAKFLQGEQNFGDMVSV